VKEKREEKREAGDSKTRKAKRTKEEFFLWFFRGKRQKFFPSVCVSLSAFETCRICRYESRLPSSLTYLKLCLVFCSFFQKKSVAAFVSGTFIFHLSNKVACLPIVPPMSLSLVYYHC
jgi:hypothetical protein